MLEDLGASSSPPAPLLHVLALHAFTLRKISNALMTVRFEIKIPMSGLHEERRRSPRKRTLKGAKIIFNHRHCVVDCVVRNLTSQGALLIVPNVAGIPNDFDLYIDGEPNNHSAHVIWKTKNSLGVAWD
jgi:hypothetical protein